MSQKTLNLDLAKTPLLKSIVYGRIGDEDMQTVTVNITSRDTPVDLTGFTITFEGITSGGQTKVFDVDGISSTTTGLEAGTFDYTFPNMAFAVAGNYEIAYFSIVKGDKRDTTGEFDIIVDGNADIDAPLAETIITEYNRLVKELHEITDKYISDSDVKFADLNQKISDLQAKITQYQNTVKDTADTAVFTINTTKDSAVSTVDTAASNAVETINDALEEFNAGDFYSKSETDSKLIDLSTTIETKADESIVVHNTGDETISGSKSFANIEVTDTFTERTTTVDITGFYTLILTLRRTGNDVELISTRTTISSAAGHEQTDAGFNIPTGFRPISRALAKVEMNNSTTLYNPMILRLDSDGEVYLTNEAFSNNRYAQCYATWKTNDPWPS